MNLERKFSQELAGDLRQETADKLRVARNMPTNFKDLKEEMADQKNLPKDYDVWSGTEEKFESLKKDIWGKIFKTEKYRQQKISLSETLFAKKEYDIKNIQSEYEQKFNEILTKCPLSLEERKEYLSTEAMEKMPLDDYLTLLKRLSGEAFYHVTRYGVRENTFMSTGGGHTASEGELVDNFIPLLKDGHINSATSTVINNPKILKSQINEGAILDLKKEGQSVDEIVDKIMASFATPYFLDRESTHFSYGKDLHRMYGGEDNYKFYFYYPVEYILQNDFFQKTRESQINIGRNAYHNRGGIDQQYNDFEIFNFGQGVSTEAGILCITGNIQVDPETGSQYALKNGKPELDESGGFKKPEKTITSQEYWNNYFMIHPELKPNKIIYNNFATRADADSPELQELAKSKNIHYQDDKKMKEFKDYQASTRAVIKKICAEIVSEI